MESINTAVAGTIRVLLADVSAAWLARCFYPKEEQHHRTTDDHRVGVSHSSTIKRPLGIAEHVDQPSSKKNSSSKRLTETKSWAVLIGRSRVQGGPAGNQRDQHDNGHHHQLQGVLWHGDQLK